MKAPIIAVFAAPRADTPEAEGFLRLLAALVACGHPLRLLAHGAGLGVLGGQAVSDEADRYLEGLAAFQIEVEALAPEEVLELVVEAPALLRFGDPLRAASPALLRIDQGAPSATALAEAGQVVRVPRAK